MKPEEWANKLKETWKVLSSPERENSVALGACILFALVACLKEEKSETPIQDAVELSIEIHKEVLRQSQKVNE